MITDARTATFPDWLMAVAQPIIESAQNNRYFRNFAAIDFTEQQTIEYFATYFPRSYAVSYCIFKHLFTSRASIFSTKAKLNIYDFGCGSGGELFGFLDAVNTWLPNVKEVMVRGNDANQFAIELCKGLFDSASTCAGWNMRVDYKICQYSFETFERAERALGGMGNKYDFAVAFKSLGEVVSRMSWGKRNPYYEFAKLALPNLEENGLVVLCDVASSVELADCPRIDNHSAPCMQDEFGSCALVDYAEYLRHESENKYAMVSGCCPRRAGSQCQCDVGVVDGSRVCPIRMDNVWYRDLMRKALKVGVSIDNNLMAHSSGYAEQKEFHLLDSIGNEIFHDTVFWLAQQNEDLSYLQ